MLGCGAAATADASSLSMGKAESRPERTASACERTTAGRPFGLTVTERPDARKKRTCAAGCFSGAHRAAISSSLSNRPDTLLSPRSTGLKGPAPSRRRGCSRAGQSCTNCEPTAGSLEIHGRSAQEFHRPRTWFEGLGGMCSWIRQEVETGRASGAWLIEFMSARMSPLYGGRGGILRRIVRLAPLGARTHECKHVKRATVNGGSTPISAPAPQSTLDAPAVYDRFRFWQRRNPHRRPSCRGTTLELVAVSTGNCHGWW